MGPSRWVKVPGLERKVSGVSVQFSGFLEVSAFRFQLPGGFVLTPET
jgi:hypothetical protein